MVGHHPAFDVLRQCRDEQQQDLKTAEGLAHKAFVPKWQAHVQRKIDEYTGTLNSEGRANLASFERAFAFLVEKCGVRLGFLQQQLFDIGRLILLKRMFGDSIAMELHYLRTKFNIQRLFEQAAVTLPRRSGKSVVQTLLAVVVAVSQPDGNVVNFNLQARQAVSWLAKCLQWLELFQGSEEFKFKYVRVDSRESVTITNCKGTRATISSFPGPKDEDASNFRGMGDKLMLLMYDEFYFFKEHIYPTTLPLATNGAAILMISSMAKKAGSAVGRMIYTKLEDGSNFFLHLDWMRACPECTHLGRANSCTHIELRPQHFQPRGSLKRQRTLISPFGTENFDRELLNIMAKNNIEPVFHPDLVNALRDTRKDFEADSRHSFKEIFIGYDPAGDKGFSEAVAVSVIFDTDTPPPGVDRRAIIVSAERVPEKAYEMIAKNLVEHARRVRQRLNLPYAHVVFCLENNSILVAHNVANAIETLGLKNSTIMRETRVYHRSGGVLPTIDTRVGIRTVHANKEAGIHATRHLLFTGALAFHKNFFVPNAELLPAEEVKAMRSKVIDEFACMSAVYVEPTGGQRRNPKAGGIAYMGYRSDGRRNQDDYVMAFIFCLLCYAPFRATPLTHARVTGASLHGVFL